MSNIKLATRWLAINANTILRVLGVTQLRGKSEIKKIKYKNKIYKSNISRDTNPTAKTVIDTSLEQQPINTVFLESFTFSFTVLSESY